MMEGGPVKSKSEECTKSTEQRRNNASLKDVPIFPRKDESVLGMDQNIKHAVMKDATPKSRKEVCVKNMELGQKSSVMKDTPAMPRKEGYVGGMKKNEGAIIYSYGKCSNFAQKGGVCTRQGAKQKAKSMH